MPRAYFTSRNVATLPAPARGVIDYADDAEGAVPWFELRVTAKGKRTFTVGYRVGRRKRRVRLGTWPGVSLAAARERARQILAEVTQGGILRPNGIAPVATRTLRRWPHASSATASRTWRR